VRCFSKKTNDFKVALEIKGGKPFARRSELEDAHVDSRLDPTSGSHAPWLLREQATAPLGVVAAGSPLPVG
jgi:hypothetical protein